MWRSISQALTAFYYSLPIQLLVIQINGHKTLLAFWAVLWGLASGALGTGAGFHHLLLRPEYMGEVGFWSFFITGSALGAFVFTYMITLYIIESYHFHFIALSRNPFFHFSYNNFLVPGSFLIYYITRFIRWEEMADGTHSMVIPADLFGLVLGIGTVFLLFSLYFFATNKNISLLLGDGIQQQLDQHKRKQSRKSRRKNPRKSSRGRKSVKAKNPMVKKARNTLRTQYRVDSYFIFPFRIEKVDDYIPIELRALFRVLNQHHANLLFLLFACVGTIAILGLFEANPYFQLPAGVNILLFFSLLILVMGMVVFWFHRVGALVFIGVVLLGYFYTTTSLFRESHMAFGLNYQVEAAPYNLDHIDSLINDDFYQADKELTRQMLDQWKANYQAKYGANRNPKAVFICTSGGGMKSGYWTMRVIQELDSITQGELPDNIRVMSGASGGMFGSTYYRELYWRKQRGEMDSLYQRKYLEPLGKDLLNRITFKSFTDLLLPNQHIEIAGKCYNKERGLSFDDQVEINMPELRGRKLCDYAEPERNGLIPQLIFCPTIINRGRKLFIASNPVSYLARPNQITERYESKTAGVEFRRFFEEQEADSLWISTAMRMNATFPYILPVVGLPSEPQMKVFDAGAIDNYGTQTAVKYLYEFRDWFARNTDAVIIVQIRDNQRQDPILDLSSENMLSKLMIPLGNGYHTISEARDMSNDYVLEFIKEWYKGYIEVVSFEYPEESLEEPAAMSFHLVESEKKSLREGIQTEHNQQAFQTVLQLYERGAISER